MGNSINDIAAHVKKHGISRTNRFFVNIPLPLRLSINASAGEIRTQEVSNDLASPDMPKWLNFACEDAVFPSKNISTHEVKFGYGPTRPLPYDSTFAPILLSFRLSKDFIEKKFFDNWINKIQDPHNYEFNFHNEYSTDITIVQLDEGTVNKETKEIIPESSVYSIKLKDAYPSETNALQLSMNDRDTYHILGVTFSYRDWTESSFKLLPEQLTSTQSQHEVDLKNSYGIYRPSWFPSSFPTTINDIIYDTIRF
jgi:hypothetical protein